MDRGYEDKYRSLFESSPESIAILDLNGVMIDCNQTSARLNGRRKEEVVGKHFTEIHVLKKEDMPGFKKLFARIVKGERVGPVEVGIPRKGESMRWVEVYPSLLLKGGKPCAIQVISHDITQRKNAEESLRESEEKYRNLVENMADVIYSVDATRKITSINRAVKRITGVEPEELIGTNFMKWIPEEEQARTAEALKRTMRGEEVFAESIAVDKDGNRHNIEFRSTPVVRSGKVVGVRGIVRDVTDRKRTEEELKAKNIALREILGQVEAEKRKTRDDIANNIREVLLPMVKKLRLRGASRKYGELLHHHLETMTSSYGRKITDKARRLTPREVEICNAIKGGLSSKDISRILNISYQTVERHRKNIRQKLNIAAQKINLTSFLNML